MKRRLNNKSGAAIAIFTGILSIGLLSWDFKQPGSVFTDNDISDTIPPGREKKIRDLDDVLKELDDAQFKMDKNFKPDMEKMKKEMEESFKKIDMDKLKAEIDRGLKEMDMDKIKMEVEKSIAKIDWDKMKADMEKVKEIDMGKMELDMKKMEEEMKKIGPEIEKSMVKIKEMDFSKLELDMKKMEEEMKKIGPEMEKAMEKAKVEIEKAKEEMKEYKTFVDGLDKDGLIDKKKEYTIKHKDGEFIINGKKQPAEVYNKYRSFLEKHKTFTIEKSDDDFNIDID